MKNPKNYDKGHPPPTENKRKQPAFLARARSRGVRSDEDGKATAEPTRKSAAAAAAQWTANHRYPEAEKSASWSFTNNPQKERRRRRMPDVNFGRGLKEGEEREGTDEEAEEGEEKRKRHGK